MISTNEILFRIKKALNLSTEEMIEAYKLEGYTMEASHLESLLKRHLDDGFIIASYEELGVFLDGFVALKRGPSPKKPNDDEAVELTNNLILKKLRIALELKEAETEIIFNLADVELSKQQLASLFRKEGHKNFKECSDELLMAFLDGLYEFYFVGEID
ncbi:DUF1456 family protein [Sulfurovum sp.]|jgi:uncharacterized protein YehS (DUF1456 family)|uniref:DUF1456 family protein n=1 Tax=Sulfurovum sp. TaxID=1969726 RepID=UPI00356A0288